MSKVVRLPLMSLIDDDSVDFEFNTKSRFDFLNDVNVKRVLQLKVRVKCLISGIVASTVSESIITNLLVTLIEDGNYFKKGFLFDCEKSCLDFDSLGATRLNCPEVEVGSHKVVDKHIKCIGDFNIDISRAKMLIANFLIVR